MLDNRAAGTLIMGDQAGAVVQKQAAPPRRFKAVAFRLLSVAIGLAVPLLASEIALRVTGWPSPGFYVQGAGPVELRPPGRGGGAFPPGVHGELRHYDYSVEWNVNSQGFRDAEPMPKRSGEWRIGVLGDSFTAGIGVPQQDRFSDVFRAGIQKSRPNITVWNLGAPLCGTACESDMLRAVNERYQLDEIVLAFYGGNDLEDNAAWYANNQTTRANNQETLTAKTKGWLRLHSRLATFLWINLARAGATFRPPGIFSKSDLDRFWPATENSLRSLRQAGESRRLTILYLPSSPEWDDALWQVMRSRYHVTDDGRYLVRDALADWSRREGVDFLDATNWLKNCGSQSECVFPVDPHWKAKPHLLVAKGMLAQSKWSGATQ